VAYWGSKPIDCDFAFDGVGVYVILIKERMFQDAVNVINDRHNEQAIIASLRCLRLIVEEYPKSFGASFLQSDFEKAKSLFYEWYELCGDAIPDKYRVKLLHEAEKEFRVYEKKVFR
jgi:hypothetical protein